MRRELRKWRRDGGNGEEYRKRKYKELCEQKKKEGGERMEREAEEIRTEEVWELVKKERKR